MARTPEQILQLELGAMIFRIATLAAENDSLQEQLDAANKALEEMSKNEKKPK